MSGGSGPPTATVGTPLRQPSEAQGDAGGMSGRRASVRAIKRRRFDDELVESSLTPGRQRGHSISLQGTPGGASVGSSATSPAVAPAELVGADAAQAPPLLQQKKKGTFVLRAVTSALSTPQPPRAPPASATSTPSARPRRASVAVSAPLPSEGPSHAPALPSSQPPDAQAQQPPRPHAQRGTTRAAAIAAVRATAAAAHRRAPSARVASLAAAAGSQESPSVPEGDPALRRWLPADDLLLIHSVSHVGDIDAVFRTARFSKRFSHQEVAERWYALLYDPVISAHACAAIKSACGSLSGVSLVTVPFTADEEKALAALGTADDATLSRVLEEHRAVFHSSRTLPALRRHWTRMACMGLVAGVALAAEGTTLPDEARLDDIERAMEVDPHLMPPVGAEMLREIERAERSDRRRMRQLEAALIASSSALVALTRTSAEKSAAAPSAASQSTTVAVAGTASAHASADGIALQHTQDAPKPAIAVDGTHGTNGPTNEDKQPAVAGAAVPPVTPKRERDEDSALEGEASHPAKVPRVDGACVAGGASCADKAAAGPAVADMVSKFGPFSDAETNSLGLLRGAKRHYFLRARKVMLGRATQAGPSVDVDLSEEPFSFMVSRAQAEIKLRMDGRFRLRNAGRRVVVVNGKRLEMGAKAWLPGNSLIEIGDVRLVFEINWALMDRLAALMR